MQRALLRAGCTPTCSEYSAELPLPPALYGATDVEEGPPADREDLEEHRAQGGTAEVVLYSKIHKLRVHESVLPFIEEETSAGRNACEAKLGRVGGKDRLHDNVVVEVVAGAGRKHRPRSTR